MALVVEPLMARGLRLAASEYDEHRRTKDGYVDVRPKTPERDVLAAVMQVLGMHPKVAWARRINSGVMQTSGRFVRFGFPGCSDILGQMRDGRMLAVEVKRTDGKLTELQVEFLGLVSRNHGVALCARGVNDVLKALAAA